jgi:hypothetical protein
MRVSCGQFTPTKADWRKQAITLIWAREATNALPLGSVRKGITLMKPIGERILYCLSYTAVLSYFLPCASVPLVVTVRLLPSAATTTWAVRTILPPFFDVT